MPGDLSLFTSAVVGLEGVGEIFIAQSDAVVLDDQIDVACVRNGRHGEYQSSVLRLELDRIADKISQDLGEGTGRAGHEFIRERRSDLYIEQLWT
jgi:hypothetical protein